MTARPLPSGQQGPIRLYGAIAPCMTTEQIAALAKSEPFRTGKTGLYVDAYAPARLGLEDLGLALDYLPDDPETGLPHVVVHFQVPDADHRALGLEALSRVVQRLTPNALALDLPPKTEDPRGEFLRDLHLKLAYGPRLAPYLYVKRTEHRDYGLYLPSTDGLPSHRLWRCLPRAVPPTGRVDVFTDYLTEALTYADGPASVVDSIVVPLTNDGTDAEFLAWCRTTIDSRHG